MTEAKAQARRPCAVSRSSLAPYLTFDRERMMGRQPAYARDVPDPDVVRTGNAGRQRRRGGDLVVDHRVAGLQRLSRRQLAAVVAQHRMRRMGGVADQPQYASPSD